MAVDDKEIKQIIEEYNKRLQSWGSSERWTLGQFKILEDLIYDASKVRVNANTLRRFFQQRTLSPQLATRNALCKFLGYDGYNDFVMRNIVGATQKEDPQPAPDDKDETPAEEPVAAEVPQPQSVDEVKTVPEVKTATTVQDSPAPQPINPVEPPSAGPEPTDKPTVPRKRHMRRIAAAALLAILAISAILYPRIKDYFENRSIQKIRFEANRLKGISPLTVQLTYDIPEDLLKGSYIVATESNGDSTIRKFDKGAGSQFFSFVYPGLGTIKLRHGDKLLKEIHVESRTKGWQAFVKEESSDYFGFHLIDTLYCRGGMLTLPRGIVPERLLTDKLFISYTYYMPDLVDGDNFSIEARVRNSAEDGGISCYDTMLYAFSETGLHGFSLNREGYSYIKFISSENTFTGANNDFTNINFDHSQWSVLRIDVINRKTTFSLNGQTLMTAYYSEPLGLIDEFTIRFKGFGAVDYVKLFNSDGRLLYQNDFDTII